MADTTFVDSQTPIIAAWLNDINKFAYRGTFGGLTPSPWAGDLANAVLELYNGVGFGSNKSTPGSYQITNAYYQSGTWKYKSANPASLYTQSAGVHAWYFAATGAANAAVSWSKGLNQDANGNVAINTDYLSVQPVYRNRLINGNMVIDQRNRGALFNITLGSGYTIDRWSGQSTGAAATGQQTGYTNGLGLSPIQKAYTINGVSSNTGVYLIQRVEAANSFDMAGRAVTISLRGYATGGAPTTLNWAMRYANATDDFTSITPISNGSFTLTNADGLYQATLTLPAGANTGLELLLSTGAFTAGAMSISNVQLELGSVATPFERRDVGTELSMCYRYYEELDVVIATSVTSPYTIPFKVTKRKGATLTTSFTSGTGGSFITLLSTSSPYPQAMAIYQYTAHSLLTTGTVKATAEL